MVATWGQSSSLEARQAPVAMQVRTMRHARIRPPHISLNTPSSWWQPGSNPFGERLKPECATHHKMTPTFSTEACLLGCAQDIQERHDMGYFKQSCSCQASADKICTSCSLTGPFCLMNPLRLEKWQASLKTTFSAQQVCIVQSKSCHNATRCWTSSPMDEAARHNERNSDLGWTEKQELKCPLLRRSLGVGKMFLREYQVVAGRQQWASQSHFVLATIASRKP